jgi:hypothetical protein
MAAPSTTAITTPDGKPLQDTYQAVLVFAKDPNISLWIKSVKPPSLSNGDPVNLTNMHNTQVRTFGPRALVTVGPVTFVASYDPDVYDEALAIMGANSNDSCTMHFPDGSTLDFYGYLQELDPQEIAEDSSDQPVANCTVQVTNWDSTNDVEEVPVMTEVAGT